MKFMSFEWQGAEAIGIRDGDEVIDLAIAAPSLPRTLLALIKADLLTEAGDAARKAGAAARRGLDEIKWLPIIPRPPKIFGLDENFSQAASRASTPGFFLSTSSRLVAHGDPIVIPEKSKTLDYGVSLAIVMKTGGKHIAPRDALAMVAGYAVFNDCSVRGLGFGSALDPSMALGPERVAVMKNCDHTAPLGPELVTTDELPLGCEGLKLSLRRDGSEVQSASTGDMFWPVAEVIQLCSTFMTLFPGDVLTAGTFEGTVAHISPDHDLRDEGLAFLRPGEIVEAEIEGIGLLRNPVANEIMVDQADAIPFFR